MGAACECRKWAIEQFGTLQSAYLLYTGLQIALGDVVRAHVQGVASETQSHPRSESMVP